MLLWEINYENSIVGKGLWGRSRGTCLAQSMFYPNLFRQAECLRQRKESLSSLYIMTLLSKLRGVSCERPWFHWALGLTFVAFEPRFHRRDAEIAEGDFSSAPIGRRRLKQKLCPFETKSNSLRGYRTYYEPRIERTEAFLFGGLSPPNKKSVSLRPLRLCVENPILDKNDIMRRVWKNKTPWLVRNTWSPEMGKRYLKNRLKRFLSLTGQVEEAKVPYITKMKRKS